MTKDPSVDMGEPCNYLTLEEIASCSGARVALDTETTGLEFWRNHIIGVSIHCSDRNVYGYFPTLEEQSREAVKEAVKRWEPGTVVIGHNLAFDLLFLGIDSIDQKWIIFDTMIMTHLWDSRLKKNLNSACDHFLGDSTKAEHVAEGKKLTKYIWDWPLNITARYAYNDTRLTWLLMEDLSHKLRGMDLLNILKHQMRYLPRLQRIKRRGMLIDTEYLSRADAVFTDHLQNLEQMLYEAIGYDFNWRSTKQLSKALYENLGIPKPINPFLSADGIDHSKFAHGGLYKSDCTNSFLLMEKVHHPLGDLVLEVRETAKLRKTVSGWTELLDDDNVIHSSFNQTGTRTGRLSSSKPNLQNLPGEMRSRETQSVFSGGNIRSDEYNLRKAFRARPGHKLVSIDYKQQEIRLFAVLAKEEDMLQVVRGGGDIHREIAKMVWNVGDDLHREWSKTVSFGLLYGMSAGSLQYRLNKTRAESNSIANTYMRRFKRIKPYMDGVINQCKREKYVRLWSGRIWREEDPGMMYRAVNALVQGGGHDLGSVAICRVGEYLNSIGMTDSIVNLVHDEILYELPIDSLQDLIPKLQDMMEVRDILDVPFATDVKLGSTYGDLVKVKNISEIPGIVKEQDNIKALAGS